MTPSAIDAVPALGGGGGAVSSVAGRTGAVVLTAADVGAGQLPTGVLLPSGIVIPSSADISGILGTSSSKAAAGNDSRLSDARTPTAHKTSHATGGSDALTAADVGATTAAAALAAAKAVTLDQFANPAAARDMGSQRITNLAAPTSVSDAAPRSYVEASGFRIGPHTYANIHPFGASGSTISGANNGRGGRIMIAETGFLRDVSVCIQTSSGNSNIIIFDTGQANGTHTTRTVLAAKGSTATPSANAWLTFDPDIAVTAGDTLEFLWSSDNGTAKVYSLNGQNAGLATLPTSSFLPSSGAGTSSQKLNAQPLAVFSFTVGSTITDANWLADGNMPLFVWRIATS